MILSTLLPGLRDVRLPLAVGLAWMIAGWIAFHDALRRAVNTTSLGSAASDLYKLLGPAASLSIVSFSAYLLGILVTFNVLRDVPIRFLMHGNYWSRKGTFAKAFNLLDDGRRENLRSYASDRLTEVTSDDPDQLKLVATRFRMPYYGKGVLVESLMKAVVQEESALADRLISSGLRSDSPQEFNEYDRRHSESEFRQTMAFPLLANVLVLTFTQTIWSLLATLPIFLLWFFGVRLGQAARSFLITTVIEGQLRSDTLMEIRS